MKQTFLSSLVFGPALLLAAMLVPGAAAAAGPITSAACTASGTAVTCNLWAETGSLTLPGPTSVTVWGFATASGGSPTLPGPVLVATEGDTVTVNLVNHLSQSTSIVFGGQTMVPDLTGAGAGSSTSYTFVASAPGTYLYEAGLIPGSQYQVAMGMYGVLVVRPAGAPGQAYGSPSTAFTDEALVVLGEVDPALNNNATPWTVDLRYFAPKYSLVNGAAHPGTASIDASAGATLLLRYANAGIQHHSIGVLGLRQSVLAADGSPIAYPRDMVAETIAPGQTADVLVTLPSTVAASTKYALYDASLTLNNSTASGIGGMLTFINATGAGSGVDTVGPITSGVALNTTSGALAGSVSDVATGNGNVTAAEYLIDATGAGGTGTAMSGAFGSPTVSVSATIPPATLAALSSGSHTVYVRGRDTLGNWGALSSVTFNLDKTGPTTSALVLTPNPSNGTVSVALSGTASDAASGNGNVTAAEYFIGAPGANGSGTTMTRNTTAPTVSLTATISPPVSSGVVSVHAQDAAGNWGPFATITITVGGAGPVTSGVAINPPAANNGQYGQSSSNPSVRVSATFVDADSTVAAGEGFIGTVGGVGTGFPFVATDGVFNAASETGYADVPLTTINLLPAGNNTISVRGKDAIGNWGATASVVLLIDKTAPTFTGITLAAVNPTLGGGINVTVNGSSDPLVAGLASGVAGGEYWIDTAAPTPGGGTPFSGLTPHVPAGSLTTGSHTVGVRVRDSAGNWSTTTSSAAVSIVAVSIFSNGFDAGGAPWGWSSRSTNTTTRLNATAASALVGARGLQAQGNNTNYVQYNFGTTANPAWPTYDARFSFNPRLNASTGQDIFAAATTTGFGTQLFHVRYRLNAGQTQVQIQAGATANATWVNITNAAHSIEVVWQAVGSVGPGPGTLVLYVDGASIQTLATASTGSVGSVRLGSVTNGGSNILMYFDAFASKRSVSPLFGP